MDDGFPGQTAVEFGPDPCGSPDCGCDRGFVGLASHRATTTALVVDLEIEPGAFRDAVRGSLDDQGWLAGLSAADADEIVDDEVGTLAFVCSHYEVGTIVRRRGSEIWCRPIAA